MAESRRVDITALERRRPKATATAKLTHAWQGKGVKKLQDERDLEPSLVPEAKWRDNGKREGTCDRVRFGNGKRPLDLVTRESLVTYKGAVSGKRERGHNAVEWGESGRWGSRDSASRGCFQEVWLTRKGKREDDSLRGRQGQGRVSLKDGGELKILVGWRGNSTQRRGRDGDTREQE